MKSQDFIVTANSSQLLPARFRPGGIGVAKLKLVVFKTIVILSQLIWLGACNPSEVEERDAVGGLGKGEADNDGVSMPSVVTGGQLTFENARSNCGFKKISKNDYRIDCAVVASDANGNEVVPGHIENGLQLTWGLPKFVSGSSFAHSNCSSSQSSLRYSCDVKLDSFVATQLQMNVELTRDENTKTESSIVLLPYAVSTYGFVAEIPRVFVRESSAKLQLNASQQKFGFQTVGLDSLNKSLDQNAQFCASNGTLYFSQNNFIYKFQDTKYTLFAGSANSGNLNEISSPFRIFFTKIVSMACTDDGLYVLDKSNSDRNARVLKINNKVELLYQYIPANPMSSPVNTLDQIAVQKNGEVLLGKNSYGLAAIQRITSTDTLETIAGIDHSYYFGTPDDGGSVANQSIGNFSNLAVGTDDEIYFVGQCAGDDLYGNCIRKIDKSGIISTVVGKGLNVLLGTPKNSLIGIAREAFISSKVSFVIHSDNSMSIFTIAKNTDFTTKNEVRVYKYKDGYIEYQVDNSGQLFTEDSFMYKSETSPEILAFRLSRSGTDSYFVLFSESFGNSEIFEVNRAGEVKKIIGRLPENEAPKPSTELQYSVVHRVHVTKTGETIVLGILRDKSNVMQIIDVHGQIKTVSRNRFSGIVSVFDKEDKLYVSDGLGKILHVAKNGDISEVLSYKCRNPNAMVIGPKNELFFLADSGFYYVDNLKNPSNSQCINIAPDENMSEVLQRNSSIEMDDQYNLYLTENRGYQLGKVKPIILVNPMYEYNSATKTRTLASPNQQEYSNWGDIKHYRYDGTLPYFAKSKITYILGKGVSTDFSDKANGTLTYISRPSGASLQSNGDIYVAESGSSRVRLLRPLTGVDEGKYSVESVIGGKNQVGECGGGISIEDQVSAADFDKSLQATLNVLCIGRPHRVSVVRNCDENNNGNVIMAFAQKFIYSDYDFLNSTLNIVRIVSPCGFATK